MGINNIKKWILVATLFSALYCLGYTKCEASKEDIKVSVIVPVYKVEPWIEDCMDSLISQTLREIEIICIDDGSPDKCGEILDNYAKKDDRIIVIHQENRGVSNARNVGIDLAKGEYITFVDPDDYIEPNTYEYTYNLAKTNNDDILEFGTTIIKDEGNRKNPVIDPSWVMKVEDRQILIEKPTDLKRIIDNYIVWNKLYKASVIKENGIKFIPDMVYEDNVFNLIAIIHIKKYESINKKFYYYRGRQGSITKQRRKFKGLDNCKKAIPAVCEEWRKMGVLKGNEDYILTVLLEKFYWTLEDSIKSGKISAQEIIDSFGDDVYNEEVFLKCSRHARNLGAKLKHFVR